MRSLNEMVERIDARLARIEHEQRKRPGWLTRLMLVDSVAVKAPVRASSHRVPSTAGDPEPR